MNDPIAELEVRRSNAHCDRRFTEMRRILDDAIDLAKKYRKDAKRYRTWRSYWCDDSDESIDVLNALKWEDGNAESWDAALDGLKEKK